MLINRTRLRIAGLVLTTPLLVAACWAQTGSVGNARESPAATSTAAPATVAASPSSSPSLSAGCPNHMPPDGGLVPLPGISIRSINRGQIEIANTAGRVYYFWVTAWVVAGDLVCGRGLLANDFMLGPIAAGETALVGVMEGVPITVEVWDRPCGEGCVRPPVGTSVVPMSSLDPPIPGQT
jgi:hypothetical protein